MVDTPTVLWILLVLFFVPLVDIATVCMRSSFLYLTVHNATMAAAKAHTFQAPAGGMPSASMVASSVATKVASSYNGVKLSSVTTQIITTKVTNKSQSVQATPLTQPADNSANTYQIQVTVTGTVDPLVTFNLPLIGQTPGLTEPITMTMSDRELAENPQGLNI